MPLPFPYQIIRSKRRTLGLRIDQKGQVSLCLPLKYSETKAESWLKTKENWVTKKLAQIKEKQAKVTKNKENLVENNQFYHFGNLQPYPEGFTPSKLLKWQNQELEKYLKTKLKIILQILKEKHKSTENKIFTGTNYAVKIKAYKAKWGCCQRKIKISKETKTALKAKEFVQNLEKLGDFDGFFDGLKKKIGLFIATKKTPAKNSEQTLPDKGVGGYNFTLSFNQKLVMFPEFVIDYLAVHEACHIWQPNHSKKYWELVDFTYQELGRQLNNQTNKESNQKPEYKNYKQAEKFLKHEAATFSF